jgi:hypothetical protein
VRMQVKLGFVARLCYKLDGIICVFSYIQLKSEVVSIIKIYNVYKITGALSANASTPRMLYWATYCHWISACRSVFLEPSLIACKYAPYISL